MAKIESREMVKVFQINEFFGLNESPDGDTYIKFGESPNMKNWMVTKEKHLKIRPGTKTIQHFDTPVRGLWHGWAAGAEHTLCAAGGSIWEICGDDARWLGDCYDDNTVFFGFNDMIYILNGHEYLVWDGSGYIDTVEGYVPLVISGAKPEGGGVAVEEVNRLTGKRRVRFVADNKGTATYQLPKEAELLSIDKVLVGTELTADYEENLADCNLTFTEGNVPEEGTVVEVWYTVPNLLRAEIESMRFAESFNGASDTRIFLYGNGTAKAYYCGVNENGQADATYFPDLYEITIGGENAPINSMLKQYNRLISFKPDGAYSTSYEVITLADGSQTSGFYTSPLHRQIGNECPGQVQLIYNYPRSIFKGVIYDWKLANKYSRDERNATPISQRVSESMANADNENIYTFDDDAKSEYYVFLNDENGTVLVNNYLNDVWYKYTNINAKCGCRAGKVLMFGMANGDLCVFDEAYTSDNGEPIDAQWESGNMDFAMDYMRKNSSTLWVNLKPTSNAYLEVSAKSDRRGGYDYKTVSAMLSGFLHMDFGNFSFNVNRQPQIERLKLKVKKFAFYKLLLRSNYASSNTVVLGIDMRVRYTSQVK